MCPRETRDLYNCICWAGAQPWSNGKVGLAGISYYAINQWMVAGLKPPYLAAICPWEGYGDRYRDVAHHGGILCTFSAVVYDKQIKQLQHGLGERGPRSRLRPRDPFGRSSSG
jgi:putative CocE/NonD family hydrolase